MAWPLLAVVASAALCALAFPPFHWPGLLWVCLAPALLALERVSPARAAALGLVHGALYAAGISAWLVPTVGDYFERSFAFTLVFQSGFWLATVGVYHGALFGVLAHARRGLPRPAWMLLVPLAWVAADFARTSLGLRSPWCRVGDAFAEWERLRQIASVTGVYGITALVLLGNAVLAETARMGLARLRGRRPCWPPLAIGLAVLAVTLGGSLAYGQRRLDHHAATSARDDGGRELLLVQGNVAPTLRWTRVGAPRVLRRYAGMTGEALRAEGTVDLVIWPEHALQTAPDDATYGEPLRGFLHSLDAPVLFGAPRYETRAGERRIYNSVFLFQPDAGLLHYDKRRLLPFSETQPLGPWLAAPEGDLAVARYWAGARPGLLPWKGGQLGVLVCFEAVYPEMARALASGGAQLLVNVANDGWFRGRGAGEQHLRQVVFRAVETGLPLVRVTSTGISAVIEPDGRVRARLDDGVSEVLRARVSPGEEPPTLYTRLGDAFAGASVGITLLASLAPLARRERRWSRQVARAA